MSDPALQVWTSFLVCVAVIGVAGYKLTDYGDAIADKTGMGGTWVGLVLIATVTSLPELAAGITAVTVAMLPDIAAGDVLGSCVYNLLILAIMDLFKRGPPVLTVARQEHVLSAGFGILLLGVGALGLTAASSGDTRLIGHIGFATPTLILLYFVAIRTLFRYQEREVESFTEREPDRFPELSLRQIGVRYAIAALFVVAAGVWLPFVSEDIATVMGWNQSFTGTLFTAMSTSLPELVVTLSCLRIGAIDLAVGNILGSNLFNLLILAIDDLFYMPGPLLDAVSPLHLVSAITAMTMTGALIAGVFYRSNHRVFRIGGWTSLLLFVLFAINSWMIYNPGAH